MEILDKSLVDTIIIHCSATEYGNRALYKRWHKKRGFEDVGYHYIINNCYPTKKMWDEKRPLITKDGYIEKGRSLDFIGAHTKKHNHYTIGICLVGDRVFSSKQLKSLKIVVDKIRKIYNIKYIKGHYEFDTAKEQGKTCPNIEMDFLRDFLKI